MPFRNSIENRLRRVSDMSAAVLPGQTLIELLDTGRVIIENHKGVCLYSKEEIAVKTCFGAVIIEGDCLEIAKMTKEQLVIIGSITGLKLERVGRT